MGVLVGLLVAALLAALVRIAFWKRSSEVWRNRETACCDALASTLAQLYNVENTSRLALERAVAVYDCQPTEDNLDHARAALRVWDVCFERAKAGVPELRMSACANTLEPEAQRHYSDLHEDVRRALMDSAHNGLAVNYERLVGWAWYSDSRLQKAGLPPVSHVARRARRSPTT